MMLSGDFFHITQIENEAGQISALLSIDPGHRIFHGHFPGQPVVPGVCMMQMVKEILQTVTNRRLKLSLAQEIKFLVVIDPVKNNIVSANIQYTEAEPGMIRVAATISKDAVTHFKFKGQFDYL